jgi:hypothetical protein
MNSGGRRLVGALREAASWLWRGYGFSSIRVLEFLNTEKRFEVFNALLSGALNTGPTVGTDRRHFSPWNERGTACI